MRATTNGLKRAASALVWRQFLPALERGREGYQAQLRAHLIRAIVEGRIPPGTRLPSSRELAESLGIARITVVLTYTHLLEAGYVESRRRSGYFVSRALPASAPPPAGAATVRDSVPDWNSRLAVHPEGEKWLEKPHDWQHYPYPFVYGQFDPTLFPTDDWRECSKLALEASAIYGWAPDAIDADDPLLVEQVRARVLPRRGIAAAADEILVTLGAQHALFLLAELLVRPNAVAGIEDPGYMDARNILVRRQAQTIGLPMDEEGVAVSSALARCQYLYCTPSHHCPTGVTMSTERRLALLGAAAAHDFIIIEDDYDAETQYSGQALPALKAMDHAGRVLYIGSFSKTLFPGVRIGYLTGPRELIARARQLRRLMIRHPPTNNQRALAIFIAQGHYDRLLARTRAALANRARSMAAALRQFLPEFSFHEPRGGSAIWLKGPGEIDLSRVETEARQNGVIVEFGGPFFCAPSPPPNYLRLGYSSIPCERIVPGIERLAETVRALHRTGKAT
jgi:GntR family transcriptional regulator/MocR family aminotransferase